MATPVRSAAILVFALGLGAAPLVRAQGVGGPQKKEKLPPRTQASSADARSGVGGEVLEITPEVLDRFAAGLAAEEAARKAIAARAAGAKSADEYAQCKVAASTSPEGMKILNDYTTKIGNASGGPAVVQKAAEEMTAKLDALVEKSCGPDPGKLNADVPSRLREAEATTARAQGFTPRQYAILKERVTPLCLSDPAPPGADGVKVKGEGAASYVYAPAEVQALRPRCEAFLKALVAVKR